MSLAHAAPERARRAACARSIITIRPRVFDRAPEIAARHALRRRRALRQPLIPKLPPHTSRYYAPAARSRMPSLSIIVPVLDEEASHRRGACPRSRHSRAARRRGDRRRRRQPRPHRGDRPPARRPGDRRAPRPRRADERRRGGGHAATCCCSCMPTRSCRRRPTRWCWKACATRRGNGAASTCGSRAAARSCRDRRLHELALAPHRHRHRRPGHVRHARGLRRRPAAFPTSR